MEAKEMTVKITPLHDRGLVRRLEEKETVKGGIIIPDTAREKPMKAKSLPWVLATSKRGHRVPLDVKVGDRILFGKYTGNDIEINGQEYPILREEEILVKVGAEAASGKK
jgi:chaperonin GroES